MSLPVGVLAALKIGLLTALGIGHRLYWHGDVGLVYVIVALLLSLNLVICYWEICLFFRRDHIGSRLTYWRERGRDTGRNPTTAFLVSAVPVKAAFSPKVWADVWATYSTYDDGYTDRRTYAFMVDTANGFAAVIPTVILYAAYTTEFLPPLAAGVVGIMLFWQWAYTTCVYLASVFVGKQHQNMSKGGLYGVVIGSNAPWILFSLVGLYVSVRLIVDDNYNVLSI